MRIGTSQAHTCLGTGKGGIQVVALGFLTNKKIIIIIIIIINRSKKGGCSIGKLGRPY